MAAKNRPFVIALEEHYWDADVAKTFGAGEARDPELRRRLDDLGTLRIREMDEAGIDMQVISHGAPSTQRLDAATAVPLAKRANDRLHEAVRAHPERFAGFAALPTADPKAAADELERAVEKLGFKGAMVHGPTNGVFFDDKRFWITTSGTFSPPALRCSIMEMGVDGIFFSFDSPFVPNPPGTKWMADLPLSLEDRTKILSGNTKRLLRM